MYALPTTLKATNLSLSKFLFVKDKFFDMEFMNLYFPQNISKLYPFFLELLDPQSEINK